MAADKRKRKGDTAIQNMKEAKKLSSGVIAENGVHSLSNPRFLEAFNAQREETIRKDEKSLVGRKQRLKKKLEEVKKLREKYGHEITHHFVSFNKEECGIYLQYKKQSLEDLGMPKELSERQARCLEWMKRPSPPSSPH